MSLASLYRSKTSNSLRVRLIALEEIASSSKSRTLHFYFSFLGPRVCRLRIEKQDFRFRQQLDPNLASLTRISVYPCQELLCFNVSLNVFLSCLQSKHIFFSLPHLTDLKVEWALNSFHCYLPVWMTSVGARFDLLDDEKALQLPAPIVVTGAWRSWRRSDKELTEKPIARRLKYLKSCELCWSETSRSR